MKCPLDQTELEKKTYEETIEIDFCNTCNGIWLDSGELEMIQEIKLNDYTAELKQDPDYIGKSILMAKSKDNISVKCPVCNESLERKEYGYCSQIYVDSCINGHGIWLDKGELQDLEIFYEKARIDFKTDPDE